MIVAEEPVSQWIGEGQPLFEAHWREVRSEADRAHLPLAVDRAKYAALEATGLLAAWTARTPAGALAGYNVFILLRHPHYAGVTVAQNDAIYVAPEHRPSGVALRLMRAARRGLKARGASRWTYHVKLDHDFGPVLAALRLHPAETLWEGVL